MPYTDDGLNMIRHRFKSLVKTPGDIRLLKSIVVEFGSMAIESNADDLHNWRSMAAKTLTEFLTNRGKCWDDYLAILKVEAVLESFLDVATYLELEALQKLNDLYPPQ